MKTILLSVGFLSIGLMTNAQITGCTTSTEGQYPESVIVPVCNGSVETIAEWAFTADYSVVELKQDVSYEFSAVMDGVSPFITIADEATNEILASGTNKVVYVSNANKKIKFYSHLNSNCGQNNFELIDRKVKCLGAITSYCVPVLDCGDGAVIKNVKLNDLDSTSTCSTNGYSDFTSRIANVEAGKTYNLQTEIGYGWYNQSVSVWIDYNKNLQFDENEFTYIGTIDQGVIANSVTIPADIAPGSYRIRVRLATVGQSGATANKACNTADTYGETEDYTLNINLLGTTDVTKNTVTVSPNPVSDVLNVQSTSKIKELKIINTTGQVVKTVTGASKIDMKSLPSGVYIIKITKTDNTTVTRKVIKK